MARLRFDELVKPCAPVVEIDLARRQEPAEVDGWDAEAFVAAQRHNQADPRYNLKNLLQVLKDRPEDLWFIRNECA